MNVQTHRSIFRSRSAFRPSRPRRRGSIPRIEPLENRQLLSTVDWNSNTSGSWDVATNWSPETVPGPGDDVVIDIPGVTVTIGSKVESVESIMADDPLDISGGGLTVTGDSTISGGLTMSGGTLTASGSGVSLTATGTTTVPGASLYAVGGASLLLSNLASYTGGAGSSTTLEASGAGSLLNLPNLTTWEGSVYCCGNGGAFDQVSALAGGEVSLADLTTDKGGATHILAQGTGSVVDLPVLNNLTSDQGGNTSALEVTQEGQIESPSLTSIYDTTVTQNGGSLSFPDVTSIDGSNIYVSGGASLTIPGVTEYTGGAGSSTTLEASGAGSLLNLPNLTTWEGSVYCCGNGGAFDQVSALAGGEVSLADLTTDNGGATRILAQGTGSVIDLSALTNLTSDQGGNYSALQATQGGQIKSASLTSLNDVLLTIDGTGAQDTAQITSLAGGTTLAITGGNPSFASVSTINGGNISVSNSVSLTLSGVSAYTGGVGYSTTLEASGAGSVLALPNVTTWEGSVYCCGNGGTAAQITALSGGEVTLAGLTSDKGGTTRILAQGTGSVIDLPALANLISDQGGYYSALQATRGGQIDSPKLTSLADVSLAIDGTGTEDVSQITSFTDGTLTATGGASSFNDLTDADATNFEVSEGASVTLPALTSYTGGGAGGVTSTLQASGAGSVLSLPNLTRLAAATYDSSLVQVGPSSGGDVELPDLTTATGPVRFSSSNGSGTLNISRLATFTGGALSYSGGNLEMVALVDADNTTFQIDGGVAMALPTLTQADAANFEVGAGSSLTLSGLTSYTGGGAGGVTSTLQASGAGSVLSLPNLTRLAAATYDSSLVQVGPSSGGDVDLPLVAQITGPVSFMCDGGSLDIGGATVSMPTSGTAAMINVPQLPQGIAVSLGTSGTLLGATFNIAQGDSVSLISGTYVGAIFNVNQGATLDLTGGQTVTYTGTLMGSGSGTVQLSGGTFAIGLGGATFNFPGSLFQWTGGVISTSVGNLTNLGTMNLAGSNDKDVYNDGTLDNFGTIIQTGSGNLGLHSDGQAPTTLTNEPGASYLIESNSGVDNPHGNQTAIVNEGTIEKTAGAGPSTILVNGTLDNTGTIQADAGTLSIAATIAQISHGVLTAGTWNAENGSTLVFPSGSNITTNEANVTVSGTGALINTFGGMTTNSGDFTLTNGAIGDTVGTLSNTGSLTVGAGSTLTVNGNYTQSSSASLTIGVGGASSGNEYGQLNITGAANLAGSVTASTASGFTPSAGENFPITTYASETGGANLSFTGVNSGALSIFQPVVGPTSIALATVASPANLVVQPFSVAANAVAGQNLTVTYQVDNESTNAATGTWTDSVYLSTQTTLNSNSVLLGRVQQSGVAANVQYTQTVTAPVTGLAPDDYYVIVLADSLGLVPELNRASTELASTNPVQITVPSLPLGSSTTGTIANGQDIYEQLTVPAGQDIAISAGLAALQAGELYVGYQTIPTSSTALASSTAPTQTTQQVVIPDTQAGTYYILLAGDTGSGSGEPFTLSAQTLPLQVTGASPSQAGNSGTTTLTIQGAEFTSDTTVTLMPHGGGNAIDASQVTFQGSTTLFAQLNLAGAPLVATTLP